MGSMKAIRIGEFVKSLDEIRPTTVPVPSPPEDRREPYYLIRVVYVSPTHVDTLYARGLHQNNNRERGHVHPPFILGMEFSGVVIKEYPPSIEAGSSGTNEEASSRFQPGDRVWGAWLGVFAEQIVASASALHAVPRGLKLREAAALGASTAPVSYGALVRVAKLKKGETCLVHAATGGLGIIAIQIALALGASVIGTVSSDAKARVVEKVLRQSSSSGQIPPGSGVVKYDEANWEEQVKRISNSHGVDVVFDTVGLVEKSIRCCNFNARVLVLGFVGRGGKMEKVAMNRVLLKQIQVLGYRYGETSRRVPEETVETWKGLDAMLNQGSIRPVIYKDFIGLASMPEALELMTTRGVAGKIVVEIDHSQDDKTQVARL